MRISDWSSDVCSSDLNNHTVQQIKGSLTVKGVRFRRSFASAIRIDGASLTTDADCRFVEGATHDNDVDNPRISHYIACYADAETSNQVISINGGVFIGDRKSVVWGKSVSVRVDCGGWRRNKKKKTRRKI